MNNGNLNNSETRGSIGESFASVTPSYSLGELFSADLLPWPQVLTRVWHYFDAAQQPHKICFRHGQVSNNWVLIVDGLVILTGSEAIVHRSFTVQFMIGESNASIVATGTNSLGYSHVLEVEQREIGESRVSSVNLGERLPTLLSIPDTRSFYADEDKLLTVYQIFVQSGNDGNAIVERRFSEFSVLDKLIKSQMEPFNYSELPKLPVKVFNPFVNQNDQQFIATRKDVLEKYLNSLLLNPQVMLMLASVVPLFSKSITLTFCSD